MKGSGRAAWLFPTCKSIAAANLGGRSRLSFPPFQGARQTAVEVHRCKVAGSSPARGQQAAVAQSVEQHVGETPVRLRARAVKRGCSSTVQSAPLFRPSGERASYTPKPMRTRAKAGRRDGRKDPGGALTGGASVVQTRTTSRLTNPYPAQGLTGNVQESLCRRSAPASTSRPSGESLSPATRRRSGTPDNGGNGASYLPPERKWFAGGATVEAYNGR